MALSWNWRSVANWKIGGFWRSFLKLGLGGAEHLEKRSNTTMKNLCKQKKRKVNLCEDQTSGFQNGG